MLQLVEQAAERLQVHPDQVSETLSQETQVEGLMQKLDSELNREE